MTASQARLPVAPSFYKFAQHGRAGHWVSELYPWTAKIADQLTVIKSLHTEAINHEPAILQLTTGNMFPGKPSLGSWLSYGLGAVNDELPTFVVLTSKMPVTRNVQALSNRLWASGFLSPEYAALRRQLIGHDASLEFRPGNPDGLPVRGVDYAAAVRRAEDMGIDPRQATRDLLAARSIKDLVRWSGGLYTPPARFRNW
jgi:hypothetical protein